MALQKNTSCSPEGREHGGFAF